MRSRWLILTVLTLARTTMGFQFQSLAAAGPALTVQSAISFTALGTLMGAYLLPGVFFALPGGWLGKRFGDKPVVLVSLAMMTAGGALLVLSGKFELMLAGRLISGIGAVLLNVLVTKMASDWFADRNLVSAMGILISSWPLGIAMALMIMGPLSESLGLAGAFAIPVAGCALALLLVAGIYTRAGESPAGDAAARENPAGGLSSCELWGAVLAGGVWCFYNIAFILPLSFGPEYLIAQGVGVAAAGAIVSLTSWLIIPALPLGGWVAESTGRPTTTLVVSFIAIALVIWAIPLMSFYTLAFALLGLIFGPAGGLIMALPTEVLRDQNRAVGMGIFFSVYYAGMGIFPVIAGYLRDVSGDPAAPLWFAGWMMLAAMPALLGFRLLLARIKPSGTLPPRNRWR